MREHEEDWKSQLDSIIIELQGFFTVFNIDKKRWITLMSKLEGINTIDTEFSLYRKIVFESISLLREMQL